MHSTRAVLVLLLAAAPLAAQGGGRGNQRPGGPPPRAAILRGQIEETFKRRAMKELALTDDQAARMSRVVQATGERRRLLEEEMRRLQDALDGELRPGVAANADSVSRMIDRMGQNRVAYAESFRDEMRDLQPVLTPIQRGQYLIMRDRLLQRIRELQDSRPPAAGPPPEE
ncbi:MAG: Spy/CpxP family protein refolding chaperone [Gemmatimonadetes bacterium]|nr:Spy/CpxP family protein refolding chaperone [Gemmatimonadota bacterium]MBP6443536.1 Spy/CpxP family protein refolding chaperone [Gemmatimonadales bacterium]MBK9547640.1 Spy/CpxP family protein refolding chaperone [Gemmatimonadota bacterium]MBP6570407.1 Spy/CpxP family protein refolding chaperone [Gemmatimonadales bacterium]MBP7620628.1 Spy/CpxP family protein refolding chaperone [Gemmatimonadales bacterium]